MVKISLKRPVMVLETDPWMRLTSFSIREMRMPVGVLVKKERERVLEMIVKFLSDIRDDSQTHKVHQISLAVIENSFN